MHTETKSPDIFYPDSDGQPMADNTRQFGWIVTIKENLDRLVPDFVAGDLLWYPVEGRPDIRLAPDALVVFGRPKGHRGSYQQWKEDDIAPQVVFEVLSPNNTRPEMEKKRQFYERYGVEEYYEYDPDREKLRGFIQKGGGLLPVANMQNFVSPRLQIRFSLTETLHLYKPDGTEFLTFAECDTLRVQAKVEVKRAEVKIKRTEIKIKRAETRAEHAENKAERAESMIQTEKTRAERAESMIQTEKTRAERAESMIQTEKNKAERAEARMTAMAAKLRALGYNPDSI